MFPPPSWNLDDEEMEGWKEREGRTSVALLEGNYEGEKEKEEEEEETLSFAKRLKGMLDVLLQSRLQASTSSVDASVEEPIPEGMDVELMRMLSSEEVMNGTLEEEEKTQAHVPVWNVLAGLRSRFTPGKAAVTPSVESDQEGIMLYGPLSPSTTEESSSSDSEDSQVSLGVSTSPSRSMEERVWVPSTVQLSILTTWWGYRLYLPPPVMALLDSTSMKATTRAAMLAGAIKWIIDKIPMALVPVQLKPAVALLKGLSPMVNYIGVFVAWSWDRVRALDRGAFVSLSLGD